LNEAFIGLGNPGRKYDKTRHNVGFKVVDQVAEKAGIDIKDKKFSSFFGIGKIENLDVCVVKPQTFMNLSGEAVRDFSRYYKIAPQDILLVHDDIDMPFGKLRIVCKSGAGGHNGVASAIEQTGTNEFYRLKMGVGRPVEGMDPADYVLATFDNLEQPVVQKMITTAAQAIFEFYGSGIEKAKQVLSC